LYEYSYEYLVYILLRILNLKNVQVL
jgi:hypothetical protein